MRKYLLLHLRRRPPARRSPNRWLPKEKNDDDLRGQPQEGGRLGQRLRGRPGRVLAPAERRPARRLQDSFLSTDRGRYLYWVDAALGTLNWASLPEGAHTGPQLAAWISSNFATATYSETTNSLSVAYNGNRLILNVELRQQFPDAADYPAAPPASPTKPFSVDHMLGPSFVSGGQQVFEFVKMMAHNEVYLRCAQLANASRALGNLGQDHAEERSGYHCGDGLRRRALHGPQGPGYPEAHALPPDRPGRQRRPASRVVFVVRVIS